MQEDIRGAFKAGAKRVSIDFTEGRLAAGTTRNPWTGRKMLAHFIDLNNRVLDRFSRRRSAGTFGIHTCPGGDCDSTHSADVDYAELLPSMFRK